MIDQKFPLHLTQIELLAPIAAQDAKVPKTRSCSLKELTECFFHPLPSAHAKPLRLWQVCVFPKGKNTLAYCVTRRFPKKSDSYANIHLYAVPKLIDRFRKAVQAVFGEGEWLFEPTAALEDNRLSVAFFLRVEHLNEESAPVLISKIENSFEFQLVQKIPELNLDVFANPETVSIVSFCEQEIVEQETAKQKRLAQFFEELACQTVISDEQEKEVEEQIARLSKEIDLGNLHGFSQQIVQIFCAIAAVPLSQRLKNKATCGVMKQLLHQCDYRISPAILEILITLAEAARNQHRRDETRSKSASKPWVDLFVLLVLKGVEEIPSSQERSFTQLLSLVCSCIDPGDFSKKIDESLAGKKAAFFYLRAFVLLKDPFYLFKFLQYPFEPNLLSQCPEMKEEIIPYFVTFYSPGNLKNSPEKCLLLLSYMEAFGGIEACYPYWILLWKDLQHPFLEARLIDLLWQEIKDTDSCLRAYRSLYSIPSIASKLESHPLFELSEEKALVAAVITRLDQLIDPDAAFALMIKGKDIKGLKDALESRLLDLYNKNPKSYLPRIASSMGEFLPALLRHQKNRLQIDLFIEQLAPQTLALLTDSTRSQIGQILVQDFFQGIFISEKTVEAFVERFIGIFNDQDLLQITFDCAKRTSVQLRPLFEAAAHPLSRSLELPQLESSDQALQWFSRVVAWNKVHKALTCEQVADYANKVFSQSIDRFEVQDPLFADLLPYLNQEAQNLLESKWQETMIDANARIFLRDLNEKEVSQNKNNRNQVLTDSLLKEMLAHCPISFLENNLQLTIHYLLIADYSVRTNKAPFSEQAIDRLKAIGKTHNLSQGSLVRHTIALLLSSEPFWERQKLAKDAAICLSSNPSLQDSNKQGLVLCFCIEQGLDKKTLDEIIALLFSDEIQQCVSSKVLGTLKEIVGSIIDKAPDDLNWALVVDWAFSKKDYLGDDTLFALAKKQSINLKTILERKIDSFIKQESASSVFALSSQFSRYLALIQSQRSLDPNLLPLVKKLSDHIVPHFRVNKQRDIFQCHSSILKENNLPPEIRACTGAMIEILMGDPGRYASQIHALYLGLHLPYLTKKTDVKGMLSEIRLYFSYIEWNFPNRKQPLFSDQRLTMLTQVGIDLIDEIKKNYPQQERSTLNVFYIHCLYKMHQSEPICSDFRAIKMGLHLFDRCLSIERPLFPVPLRSVLGERIFDQSWPLFILQRNLTSYNRQLLLPHYFAYTVLQKYIACITNQQIEETDKKVAQEFEKECWKRCYNLYTARDFEFLANLTEEQKESYSHQIAFLIQSKLRLSLSQNQNESGFERITNHELLQSLLALIAVSTPLALDLIKSIVNQKSVYSGYVIERNNDLILRQVEWSAHQAQIKSASLFPESFANSKAI